MNCSCLIDTSRWGYRQGNIFLEMMAMYCFFIRNYGKYFFRLGDRESYFSRNMGQKTASISSECGNFLLLFAHGFSLMESGYRKGKGPDKEWTRPTPACN